MQPILVIGFERGLYFYAYWMDCYIMLCSNLSLHESEGERKSLGYTVGSLIVQGRLIELAYNYIEFVLILNSLVIGL
jgi:hypothetical protein